MKNQSSSSDNQMSCSEGEDDYENDENRVVLANATELLHGDDDVAGRALYQFHTPKKRDAMMQLAENTTKTPTTGLKQLSLNSPRTPQTPGTPKSRVASLQRVKQNTTTPHETRARNKATLRKKIQQVSETESSADEDADYEPQGSSESSDEENSNDSASDSECEPGKDTKKVPPIKISTKAGRVTSMPAPSSGRMNTRGQSRAKNQEDFIPDSDNYFITASNKKVRQNSVRLKRAYFRSYDCVLLKVLKVLYAFLSLFGLEQNFRPYIGSIEIIATAARRIIQSLGQHSHERRARTSDHWDVSRSSVEFQTLDAWNFTRIQYHTVWQWFEATTVALILRTALGRQTGHCCEWFLSIAYSQRHFASDQSATAGDNGHISKWPWNGWFNRINVGQYTEWARVSCHQQHRWCYATENQRSAHH